MVQQIITMAQRLVITMVQRVIIIIVTMEVIIITTTVGPVHAVVAARTELLHKISIMGMKVTRTVMTVQISVSSLRLI